MWILVPYGFTVWLLLIVWLLSILSLNAVLDEADRILDMGFADTMNAIIENLPKKRQTLLFSATQTKSVKDLARLSLKDPEYVWVHEKAKFRYVSISFFVAWRRKGREWVLNRQWSYLTASLKQLIPWIRSYLVHLPPSLKHLILLYAFLKARNFQNGALVLADWFLGGWSCMSLVASRKSSQTGTFFFSERIVAWLL